jgi:hypothetical protein
LEATAGENLLAYTVRLQDYNKAALIAKATATAYMEAKNFGGAGRTLLLYGDALAKLPNMNNEQRRSADKAFLAAAIAYQSAGEVFNSAVCYTRIGDLYRFEKPLYAHAQYHRAQSLFFSIRRRDKVDDMQKILDTLPQVDME